MVSSMSSSRVKSLILQLDNNEGQNQTGNTKTRHKHRHLFRKYLGSRYLVLFLGPCFGVFIYYYITYLVLGNIQISNIWLKTHITIEIDFFFENQTKFAATRICPNRIKFGFKVSDSQQVSRQR